MTSKRERERRERRERNAAARERAERDPEAVCDAAAGNREIWEILEQWPEPVCVNEFAPAAMAQVARHELWLRARASEDGGVSEHDIDGIYDGRYDAYMNALRICWHLERLPRSPRAGDGVSLMAMAVEGMPLPMAQRYVIVPAELGGKRALPLVRSPDLLSLASCEALEVDGAPFVTATAMDEIGVVEYALRGQRQRGELVPGPRTIAGQEIRDPVLRALAAHPLTGDERNPLRGDVYRVCLLGYALSGPTMISEEEGVRLLTGRRVTDAGCRRWWAALGTARSLELRMNARTGQWISLLEVDVAVDGTARIEAPRWWRQGRRTWRLAGGLFRPVLLGESARGTARGYWGCMQRTVAGVEAAVSWSPSAGRGRHGRIPTLLRPEWGKAGPGPEVVVPWRTVLRLAGEHVEPDADAKGTAGRRYRDRIGTLEAAGYVVNGPAPAVAGDTIEVRPRRGGRGRGEAALVVRASARMVEAVRKSQNYGTWTRYPATSVLR